MAKNDKKKKNEFWKKVGTAAAGEAGRAFTGVGRKVDRAIHTAEKKIEEITIKAIKASTVFLLYFMGLIFILVGLAKYITVRYQFMDGVGLLIVGLALILLGWFAKLVRP